MIRHYATRRQHTQPGEEQPEEDMQNDPLPISFPFRSFLLTLFRSSILPVNLIGGRRLSEGRLHANFIPIMP